MTHYGLNNRYSIPSRCWNFSLRYHVYSTTEAYVASYPVAVNSWAKEANREANHLPLGSMCYGTSANLLSPTLPYVTGPYPTPPHRIQTLPALPYRRHVIHTHSQWLELTDASLNRLKHW